MNGNTYGGKKAYIGTDTPSLFSYAAYLRQLELERNNGESGLT
jgi:hypothetical protein